MYRYTNIQTIRTKMNEAGLRRKPFLFGIDYEMSEGFFVEDPLSQEEIFFQIRGVGNKQKPSAPLPDILFHSFPISYSEYKRRFDIVHKGLRRGDSFLTNLTIKTKIDTNLTLLDIFEHSTAPYQLCIPDNLVCFSPERFVCIQDGVISSNPMKGTIDASVDNATDLILTDFKETAEHNTIVDLIRNDLSVVASGVHVSRFRYLDKISTRNKEIFQVSSEIKGHLSAGYHSCIGDVLFGMLPAGSISGAPKKSTMALIRQAEGESRGYYTGIFGYYDGSRLDSGVMIRYIERQGDAFFYRSGGGITAYSNSEEEYAEVLNKIYLPFV